MYGRNGADTAARLAVRSRVKMERLDNIALFPDESRRKYICLSLTYRQLVNNEVIFFLFTAMRNTVRTGYI